MASKMYILIKENVDLGHAILGAAHASLSGYLTFNDYQQTVDYKVSTGIMIQNETPTEKWARQSFRKVVCKVTNEEFDKAKTYGKNMQDYRIMVESGLDNAEIAIVFAPREDWEPFFKSLRLYK